ncbi:MAG: serine/threonine-protein kinase, partial [Myxococcota bacterium]
MVFTKGPEPEAHATNDDTGPLRPPLRAKGESTDALGGSLAEEGPVARVGDMVGNYRLLDVIGRGGMGRVYRAEHVLLGRQVALKMLRRRFSDNRQAVARFIAEARAISQIEHDHIVKVTDFIESLDGHVCFVMELLSGQTAAELLREQGPPSLDDALRIGAQVCEAVAAVHDAGFIHRDVKPENILLTRHPTRGTVAKLLDFGIAKLVDTAVGEPQAPDLSSGFGTPAYMSPEQLVGGVVDHRADVYGLGMVLYELTTGKRPFDLDESVGDAVLQQLTLPPVPPSRRATAPQGFPVDLEQLLLQCLEKGAHQRPRSAREVGARLTAIADQRATLERAVRSLPTGAPDSFDEETAPMSVRELAAHQAYASQEIDLFVIPGQPTSTSAPFQADNSWAAAAEGVHSPFSTEPEATAPVARSNHSLRHRSAWAV